MFLLNLGNNNPIKTYRPVTNFNRIQFGEFADDQNLNNFYNIQLINASIDVFIYFNVNEQQGDELTLEIDQNLQKYFIIDSDGNCLKIKLDFLDDEYSIINSVKELDPSQILVKNQTNFISTNKNVRINVRTRKSFTYVHKIGFAKTKLNFFIEPVLNVSNLNQNLILSTISLNCTNNEYSIDNGRVNINKNTQLIKKIYASSHYLSVNYCDDSFALYFGQSLTNKTNEFRAFRNFSFYQAM